MLATSKDGLTAIVVTVALFLVIQIPVHASTETDFDLGQQAFGQKDFKKAAKYFERAGKNGMRRVSLFYNLGVTYYQLGDYEKAKLNFEIVARSNDMASVAHYNLGRVARKQRRSEAARKHFFLVLETSKDERLRRLARSNLAQLRSKQGIWTGAVAAKTGYDDNVTAVSGAAKGESAFLNVSGYTQNLISGTRKNGVSISGDFSLLDYFSQNEDQSAIRLGVKRWTRWGKMPTYYRGYIDTSTYRGSAYQNILGLEAGGRRNLENGTSLRMRYRFENISSLNPAYDYLQGWRQRFRFEHRKRNTKAKKRRRYYYELELNDRQDKTGPAESFSPIRNTLRGTYYWAQSKTWDMTGDISYRHSAYPNLGTQSRTDQRFRFGFTVSKKLKKDLKLRIKYRHTTNNSTVTNYSYASNRIYAGISYYY
ncbi:MAG: tetratricopeptide repeat protein [Acidiferrobacterales bacterium]